MDGSRARTVFTDPPYNVRLVARLLDQSEHDDPSAPLAADGAAILAALEARIRNTTPDKGE